MPPPAFNRSPSATTLTVLTPSGTEKPSASGVTVSACWSVIAPAPASSATSAAAPAPAATYPTSMPTPVREMSFASLSVRLRTSVAVIGPPAVTVIAPFAVSTSVRVMPSVSASVSERPACAVTPPWKSFAASSSVMAPPAALSSAVPAMLTAPAVSCAMSCPITAAATSPLNVPPN